MKTMRNRAFTIIELISVIVILGILSATAVPKFIELKKDANTAVLNGIKASIISSIEIAQVKTFINGLDKYCVTLPSNSNMENDNFSSFSCKVATNKPSLATKTNVEYVKNTIYFQTAYAIPTARVEGIISSFQGELNQNKTDSTFIDNRFFAQLKTYDSSTHYRSCGNSSELCYLYIKPAVGWPVSGAKKTANSERPGEYDGTPGVMLIAARNSIGAYFNSSDTTQATLDTDKSCVLLYKMYFTYNKSGTITGARYELKIYNGGC